jgi:hypothetical protein
MNSFGSNSKFRDSVAAILCTVLFSTTCLVGALGPARAADANTSPAPVVRILA